MHQNLVHRPSAVDPELAGERTQASNGAALIVTGNRSDYTLGRVVELLNLQNDPTISEHLRRVVEDALANIDPHGPVEPNYLRVKIAQDTEQLELLATGTHIDPEIGSAARAELAALPAQGRPAQIRQAAKAALQRATATTTERRTALVETRRPPTTIRTYSPRALTEMITELDYWWLHYDPVDAAATLTAEQWEQLTDWVHHTVQFLEGAARAPPAPRRVTSGDAAVGLGPGTCRHGHLRTPPPPLRPTARDARPDPPPLRAGDGGSRCMPGTTPTRATRSD